jgi:glycosyltransferase involved in cell wall biosynthesis
MPGPKRNILFINHAGSLGGAPKSMSYIIKNLDKDRFKPMLINIESGPVNDFFKTLQVEFKRVKGIKPFHGSTVVEKSAKLFIRNYLFVIPSIINSYFILKKIKPDIIHLNSTCLFPVAIAAKIHNIKVISHVREPLRKGIWGAPLRFFCKKFVDGFIAICKNDLDSLNLLDKSTFKSEVIYNFVEQPKPFSGNNLLKNELNLKIEDVVFLYLARFSKSNGWKELIEIVKPLTETFLNYHFVFVGAQGKSQLNYCNNSNIHLLPFRQDVEMILNCSDVFICPFVEPHFARGVIEASSYGLPIIGANIGGVNELVVHNETGFLYSKNSELEKYIKLLGTDSQKRKELGKKGVAFAELKFKLELNLAKTYQFYDNFLN